MSGSLGKVSGQNVRNILDDWVSVSVKEDEKAPGGVRLQEREIDIENKFKLTSASKLKHPAPVKSTGSKGVAHLAQQRHAPTGEGGPDDMSTVRGTRDALMKYCENFRAKFLDKGDLKARLATFRKQLDDLESAVRKAKGTEAEKAANERLQTARGKFAAFQEKCSLLQKAREDLLAFFPKPGARPMPNLNPSAEYLDKCAAAELAEMRVAVRNFRYDYDKFNSGGKLLGTRELGQFFSSTRNSFFRRFVSTKHRSDKDIRTNEAHLAVHAEQRISPGAFEWEQRLSFELYQLHEDLVKTLAPEQRPMTVDDFWGARANLNTSFGTGLLKLEEALRTKCADAPLAQAGRDQLLKTLKEIGDPEKGGYKKLALVATAGGVLPVEIAKVTVGMKYRFCLDIESLPGGRISIRRVHSLGIKADLDLGIKGLARVKAGAEGGVEKGKALEFDNYEDAVASLSKSGPGSYFHGLWTGGIGGNLKDIPFKLIGRIFAPANNYNERAFLHYARANGFLDKVDATLAAGANVPVAARQKILRLKGSAKADAQAQLARLRGELSGEGYRGFNRVRTENRSFFTYFRNERKGEAADVYLKRVGSWISPPSGTLEDVKGVCHLLAESPEQLARLPEDERAARRADILAELGRIVDGVIRESDSVLDLLGNGRDLSKKEYLRIARMFPQATAAAQALIDRLEILSKGLTSEEKASADKIVATVERALSNPPIKFPPDIFEKEFSVHRSYLTGGGHVGGEFRFSYDLSVLRDAKFLTEGFLASSGTYSTGTPGEKIALGARRAAASGVSGVVTNLTASSSSVSVRVSHDTPRSNDPRPWSSHKQTTLDIRLKDNLPTRAIYAVIMNAVTRTVSDKESGCADAGLSVGEVGMGSLGKFLTSALTRAYSDLSGKEKADQSIRDGVSIFAESILDDYVWEGVKNIRLSFQDGQLASISFGDAETIRVEIGLSAGFVKASGGFSYESLVNTRTMLHNPTFDALTGYCDAFLRSGKRTAWRQFATHNAKPFLRMFNVLAGKDTSKQGLKSLDELLKLRQRIIEDIQDTTEPEMRSRLEKCREDLDVALGDLRRDAAAALPTDKKDRARAMNRRIADVRRVLEAAARYYDVSEDRNPERIEAIAPVRADEQTFRIGGGPQTIFLP